MTSQELFDQGYAIKVYNIDNDVQDWIYRERYYRTSGIDTLLVDGIRVARWEVVSTKVGNDLPNLP